MARLTDSNHPKSPSLLTEQPPMEAGVLLLRTTEFSAWSLLSGLLGARSRSFMFPNRDVVRN